MISPRLSVANNSPSCLRHSTGEQSVYLDVWFDAHKTYKLKLLLIVMSINSNAKLQDAKATAVCMQQLGCAHMYGDIVMRFHHWIFVDTH